MTEKVVSLSGGLVLGMVFALFLGIGATQNVSSSVNFEIPSVMQMTIAQNTHGSSAPASNTTPAVDATTPVNEDRGRITRIATVTESTDPVIAQATTTTTIEPKNWHYDSSPKIDNGLRRANLQHTYIASNTPAPSTCARPNITTARESNFVTIAVSSESGANSYYGHSPSFVDSKPQSHGSPTIAHNDPGPSLDPGSGSSLTGGTNKPNPATRPNLISDDNTRRNANFVNPRPNVGGGTEFDSGNNMISRGNHR